MRFATPQLFRSVISAASASVTLRAKLCAAIVVPTVLLMVTVSSVADRSIEGAVERQIRDGLTRAVQVFDSLQQARLRELAVDARMLAEVPQLKAVVSTPGIDYETYLDSARDARDVVGADILVLSDERGELLAVASELESSPSGFVSESALSAALHGQPSQELRVVHGKVYQTATHPFAFGDHIVGVVSVGFELSAGSLDGLAKMVDADLAVFGPQLQITSVAFKDHLIDQVTEHSHGESTDGHGTGPVVSDGERSLVLTRAMVGTDLHYVVSRSLDERLAFYELLRSQLMIISCVLLLTALAAGVAYARHLTRPIEALRWATKRIAEGDFGRTVEVQSSDEIGELAVSFNAMSLELRDRIDQEKELATAAAVVETERRRAKELAAAYAELKETQGKLIQNEKMAALGVMAGGIAHDFNNILGAMIGSAELTIRKVEAGSREHENLNRILQAGYRATQLVKQLLTYTRQSVVKQEAVEVDRAVQEVLSLIATSTPDTIEIRSEVAADTGAVLADETQLTQLLLNLSRNACQAMGEKGGVLSIHVGPITVDESFAAAFPGLAPGPYVKLTVADTGAGMDDATVARIFDPFFTTKGVNEGTGMGLSVVQGVVESCSGVIKVVSRVGEGTTFDVYLPRLDHGAIALTDEAEIDIRGRGAVMVVDDDLGVAETAKALLEEMGYTVTMLTDSVKALEVFRSHPQSFAAVLTDQAMPGMSGAELAQAILRICPSIPIVLASGYSEQVTPQNIASYGIRAFVTKPYRSQDLGRALRIALCDESQVATT